VPVELLQRTLPPRGRLRALPRTRYRTLRSLYSMPHYGIGFCSSADGTRIGYATFGNGPALVVAEARFSHLGLEWEEPRVRHFWETIGQHHTVVRYDIHGCGLSDRNRSEFSLDSEVRPIIGSQAPLPVSISTHTTGIKEVCFLLYRPIGCAMVTRQGGSRNTPGEPAESSTFSCVSAERRARKDHHPLRRSARPSTWHCTA
jgi:hypothetical protein